MTDEVRLDVGAAAENNPTAAISPIGKDESTIVAVTLDIDIGEKSSMFCCVVCLELVQQPKYHRQCAECGTTICTMCIGGLPNPSECPVCRAGTTFIANSIIHRNIYPKVMKSCPWPKCNMKLLNMGAHMLTCSHRTVQCPVCHKRTPVKTIHEHLNGDCVLPWGTTHRDSASCFFSELRNIGKIPRGSYQKIFDLNPAGTKDTSENTRLIYFWRKNNPMRGFIRMMCIQLCASAEEEVGYGFDSGGDRLVMKVASMENFEAVEPTVEYADTVITHQRCAIEPGVHNLTCGDQYEIKQSNGYPFRGQLIEVLWAPPRAVFVDNDAHILESAISGSSGVKEMANIKKISMTSLGFERTRFNVMHDSFRPFAPEWLGTGDSDSDSDQDDAAGETFGSFSDPINPTPSQETRNERPEERKNRNFGLSFEEIKSFTEAVVGARQSILPGPGTSGHNSRSGGRVYEPHVMQTLDRILSSVINQRLERNSRNGNTESKRDNTDGR